MPPARQAAVSSARTGQPAADAASTKPLPDPNLQSPRTQPDANPIILPDSSIPQAQNRHRDQNQMSPDPFSARAQARHKALPLFGYNFFQPARDIILARRSYLRGKYSGGAHPAGPAPAKAQPSITNNPPTSPGGETPDSRDGSSAGNADGTAQPGAPGGQAAEAPFDSQSAPSQASTVSDDAQTELAADASAGQPADTVGSAPTADAFHGIVDPLTQLSQNVSASVPPNYQLFSGDVLAIRYWSPTRAAKDFTATIDSHGAILIPQIGQIALQGLTMPQAENALREHLRRLYKDADATITLQELRTMTITVSGEAFAPGSYIVPAISTAFNVLYAAGGPTEDGTLRAIEVRRRGRLIGALDFYSFLRSGGGGADIALQPGDLIYISPRLSRIAIRGEVRQEAIYEMKPTETLRDALRFAGGVKPSGVDQRIQINTFDPGTARVLRDINLKDLAANRIPVYDGDEIEVFSVRNTLTNRVTIEGAVDQPGDYALLSGMRLTDLVERARGPLYNAYTTRADLYRWNADNTQTLVPIDLDKALAHDPADDIPLKRWDRLKIYSRDEVAWVGKRQVTVRGAVQRPGVYYRSDNLRIRDLLLMVGGPTPEASLRQAALLHQRGDGTFAYDYIDLAQAMQGRGTDDVALQDNDILAVYRVGEAQFTPEHTVSVQGEVVAPGTYPRGEGMHLSDLLKLTGGFKPGAGTQVTVAHAHKSIDSPLSKLATVTASFDAQGNASPQDDVLLEDNDVVTVQGTGGFFNKVAVVTVKGAVNRPGPIALTGKLRLSDIIREAGGLRPEAFPEGVEFTRDSSRMSTVGQRNLAEVISSLNDLLNQSSYKREVAKSDLDQIKAAGSATQDPSAALLGGATTSAASAQYSNRNLVTPARVLTSSDLEPNGYIAVDLAEAIRKPGSSEDILLMDGDSLVVPEKPTTIQVVGAVYNARGILYRPGASLDYYISRAGGFVPDAAKDRIEIIHAGGGLIPASKVRELQPGDLILVPTQVLAQKLDKSGGGIDGIFKSLTNSAIIYKVLTGLIR